MVEQGSRGFGVFFEASIRIRSCSFGPSNKSISLDSNKPQGSLLRRIKSGHSVPLSDATLSILKPEYLGSPAETKYC